MRQALANFPVQERKRGDVHWWWIGVVSTLLTHNCRDYILAHTKSEFFNKQYGFWKKLMGNQMRKTAIFLTIVLVSLIIGCGPLKPKFVSLGTHDLTFIRTPKPVTLVNAQEIKMVKFGNFRTDLSDWTNQAITLIKWWLEENDVPIIDNAEKILNISMVNPQYDASSGCIAITLSVETGDGSLTKYPVEGCAVGVSRAAGYAISYTVLDLMRDQAIKRYISE